MDENRRVSAKRIDHREILIEQQRNRLVRASSSQTHIKSVILLSCPEQLELCFAGASIFPGDCPKDLMDHYWHCLTFRPKRFLLEEIFHCAIVAICARCYFITTQKNDLALLFVLYVSQAVEKPCHCQARLWYILNLFALYCDLSSAFLPLKVSSHCAKSRGEKKP